MNTPSHAVINLVLLGRKQPPGTWVAITVGAFLPDFTMVCFYFWHKLVLSVPEHQIWSHYYPQPHWQALFDGFHSIPLILIFLIGAYAVRAKMLSYLLLSMLLHALLDIPVHHDDAHQHFFPFSNWIFVSPISYWDPNHHGDLFSIFETVITIAGLFLLWRWRQHRTAKWTILILSTIFIIFWIFVFLTWM